jgi:hypothetical protein
MKKVLSYVGYIPAILGIFIALIGILLIEVAKFMGNDFADSNIEY